jgi:hypothetical protein
MGRQRYEIQVCKQGGWKILSRMGGTGPAHLPNLPEKPHAVNSSGAESGAVDADLQRIIAAWPKLSAQAKRRVVVAVNAAIRNVSDSGASGATEA